MYDGLPNDGITPTFKDEATGEAQDFTKPLYAVVNYGGDGKTITVNVTPLTNLAATVAGVDTSSEKPTLSGTKEEAENKVKEANAKVAQKFGLNEADLTAAEVHTTNSDKANDYGVALAIISKMEQSQTQDEVAAEFKKEVNGDSGSTFMSSLNTAVNELKTSAGTNNDYLRNIDTSKLDKVSNAGSGGTLTATGTTLTVNVVSDSTPPALTANGATTDNNGNIVLTYDDILSNTGPDKAMFSVFMNGSGAANNTVDSITVSGRTVTLVLATKIRFGDTVQVSYTDGAGNDTNATQDSVGNDAVSLVKQTVTNNVANVAPTLTSIATLTGFAEDTFKEITYADLAAAANEADVDSATISFRIEAVSTGTLQKWNGTAWVAVTAGTTTVATGEKLQWKGAQDANGLGLNAFTVKAFDGTLASSTAVQVKADVTAVNDTPTGTVSYTGTPKVGSVLTATNNIVDPDGLGSITYKWQTQSAGTWSDVFVGSSYTPQAADNGKSLRVIATYTDTGGTAETVTGTGATVVTAPYLKSVAMTDTVITLTFDQAMDVSNYPELNSLSLKINSNTAGLSNVRQGANSSEISLTYTNPTGVSWTTNRNGLYMDLNYNDANTGDAKALKSAAGGVAMDPFELTILWTNNNQSNSPPSIEGTTYRMGSGGDDFIIGGKGNDYLWGGDTLGATKGNNTFKWFWEDAGASGAVDTIKDFTRWNAGAGDKLSIYPLLSGFTLGSSTLSDWVKTVETGKTVNGVTGSTVMTIDVDGSASGTVTQVIQFEGVNLLSGVTGANLTEQLRTLQSSGVFTA